MKTQSQKKNSRKKIEVFYLIDKNTSDHKIIAHDKYGFFEILSYNVLDLLSVNEEVSVKIGKTRMTQRQLDKLPDIDEM